MKRKEEGGVYVMDMYQFLNSKDVAEYLKQIEYKFSITEAAYLIYQCKKITLQDKITAWQELIEIYPDCSYEKMSIKTDSFHKYLKAYISLQKKIIEEFYKEESGAVYWYCWHEVETDDWYSSPDDDVIFSNFNTCYQSCVKEIMERHYFEDAIEQRTFRKTWLDPKKHYGDNIDVEVNERFEITKISKSNLSDEEQEIDWIFESMWLDIPTPFKRGDILVASDEYDYLKISTPFVLNYLSTWDANEMLEQGFKERDYFVDSATERITRLKEKGSLADMWSRGYKIKGNGFVYDVESNSYLDLEYYRGKLDEKELFLKIISQFLKGEIQYHDLETQHFLHWYKRTPNGSQQLKALFNDEKENSKTIFVGGSKTFRQLPETVCKDLNEIMRKGDHVVVGDCRGTDTLIQTYLNERGYQNVTVYASGDRARNNVGNWKVCYIPAAQELSPFEFYRQKDIAMANVAEYGIMVWDGKSKGTYYNVQDLFARGIECKLYVRGED